MAIFKNKYEKLLGVNINNKLIYESHIISVCKKTAGKLLLKALIKFQFCYNQVVCIFYS